jgi:ribonuclease T2
VLRQVFRKTLVALMLIVFSFALFSNSALAFVPFEGEFTAKSNCEALSSIKKGTNPQNVRLKRGQTYQVVGKNNDVASHYQVEIDGASPSLRWVAISCLNPSDSSTLPTEPTEPTEPTKDSNKTKPSATPVASGKDYLLALSWQPAFCESKPDKTECKILAAHPDRFEATHFALHGLWPQPESNSYCGVSQTDISFDKNSAWSKLSAIENKLSPQTWSRLQVVMPGTASNLQRHEWTKHGSCYEGTPEEYFSEAINLLDAFNASPVQQLLASNIGRQVTIKDIDQALSSFGANTGDKVQVKCTNSVLGEVWVNLEGNITPTTPVADLVVNSPNAKHEKFASCLIDSAAN